MTDLVTSCVADLRRKIKTIAAFRAKDHAATLYDASTFLDATKDLSPPLAAIIYEGATPMNPGKGGMANTLHIGVYVISDREETDVLGAYSLLYSLRGAIRNTEAPSGHPWVYKGEYPIDLGTGLGYVQRWEVQAMFTN